MSELQKGVLLNETYAVSEDLSRQWSEWMVEKYIPKALDSNLIRSFIFSEVDNGVTEGTKSFALQFIIQDKEKLDSFISDLDPQLKRELNLNFAGQYASFVTILNILST